MKNRAICRDLLVGVLVALILGLSTTDAMAKKKGVGAAAAARRTQQPAPPVDTSAYDAARKQVSDDQTALTQAKEALAKIYGPLKATFESSPEMSAALAALNSAETAHQAESTAVDQQLEKDPNYQAAVAKKQEDEAKVKSLQDSPSPSQEEITAAATAALHDGQAVSQLREAIETADPKFAQSKAALVEAATKVAALRKQFEESVRSNTDLASARKAVDAAQAKLTTDQSQLDKASSQLATARAARR